MDNESKKPNVPWSRHMAISPNKINSKSQQHSSNVTNNNYEQRKAALKNRIKSISESNLCLDGRKELDHDEGSWDSQSDPGSISRRNSGNISDWYKMHKENNYNKGDNVGVSHRSTKVTRKPVQGRGAGQSIDLRKRKPVRNESRSNHKEDFVVELPAETTTPTADVSTCGHHIPGYIQSYLDLMYYSCMTPHKWVRLENMEQTKVEYALSIMQKLVFCYITIMATFASISQIKLEVISFYVERNLNQFIDIGYVVVSGAMHWYLVYFFVFRQDAISKTLRAWDAQTQQTQPVKYQKEWLPLANGIVTIIMAILKSITYTEFRSWSFQELITEGSEEITNGLFIWKPDHVYGNDTLYEPDKYIANTWIGIIGITSIWSWNFQIDCFKDLLIWVAVVNKHHTLNFGKKIRDSLARKKTTKKNSEESDDQCWEAYQELQEFNTITNSTFSVMLVINHLNSFMVLSYWLTQLLNKEVTLRVLVFVGYNVLKGVLSYISALKSSGQNDLCRKWIQSLPCDTKRFRVGDTPYTREVMLLELEKEPLGLGRGKVLIDNDFLITFITLVASLFCFLLSIDPKNEAETVLY